MKDVEQLLTKRSIQPKRELQKDFTKNIISHLDEHPRQRGVFTIKELFSMKLYTKPVFAVLAVITLAVTGGTTYAAVGGWPAIEALFGGQQEVENARVVKVDTKHCSITSAFNVTSQDQQQDAYYYKIKNDSRLTNEQVVQMVQGFCELGQSSQASLDIAAELNKNPLNKNAVVGGYVDSEVTAVSASSISIQSNIPIGSEVKTVTQTFSHIDPQVIVYEGPARLTLGDIKVGDHVSVAYRASGKTPTPSEINPMDIDPNQQVIVAVAKNSKNLTAAINYQKYNGKEFEQVIPCSEDSSGYCTAEQYHTK